MPATVIVALALLVTRALVYASVTRARDRIGAWALWSLVALLGGIYVASLIGRPPPSVPVLAVSGLAGWLVAWAYWIDRHRVVRGA